MATVNLEHQYIEFKDSMKVSDDKIYFINREGKYVKLTELYIFNGINNRATRKVKDYKDFVNNRSKISFSANNHVGVFNPLVKVFDVPNYYETTSNLTNIDEVNAGYKKYCKIAKVNRAEADKNNDFAMVFIANSSKPSFIKISDIYYYDGLTKKYINDFMI